MVNLTYTFNSIINYKKYNKYLCTFNSINVYYTFHGVISIWSVTIKIEKCTNEGKIGFIETCFVES